MPWAKKGRGRIQMIKLQQRKFINSIETIVYELSGLDWSKISFGEQEDIFSRVERIVLTKL